MTYEKSCGGIVFTLEEDTIKYVLVQQKEGFWGFPKGHINTFETEEGCAFREISEEVGVNVKLLTGFREVDEHSIPGTDVIKRIIYLCAFFDDQEIIKQDEELLDARLVTYDEAIELLKGSVETEKYWHPRIELLQKANMFIKHRIQIKKESRERLLEEISQVIPHDKLGKRVNLTGSVNPRPEDREFRKKREEMMLTDDGDGFLDDDYE